MPLAFGPSILSSNPCQAKPGIDTQLASFHYTIAVRDEKDPSPMYTVVVLVIHTTQDAWCWSSDFDMSSLRLL
jgi:hypothetical protein